KYIPYGQSVLISPKLTNVFRTIDVPSEEITFAHESGDHSGALTDDGTFSPNRLGQYTFLYGGYAQNLIIIDAAPPTIQFKDGLSNLIISGQGALSLSVNDVIAADDWGSVEVLIKCKYNGKEIDLKERFDQIGIYEITYTAVDSSSNAASITRTVLILPPNDDQPVIIWDVPAQVLKSQTIDLSKIKAVDSYSREIQVEIKRAMFVSNGVEQKLEINNGVIKFKKAGELYITVSATDAYGNSTQKLFRIEVRDQLRKVVTSDNYAVSDEVSSGAQWVIWLSISAGVLAIAAGPL
ncbi:MAG TPA: hypothetical protein VIL24_01005, partial [Clostridia bacterium]